jgi:hypothetical protein
MYENNVRKYGAKAASLSLRTSVAGDVGRIPWVSGVSECDKRHCILFILKRKREVYTSARASLLSTCWRLSRPLSDHGKWATGMRKNELLGSAIPARALYL